MVSSTRVLGCAFALVGTLTLASCFPDVTEARIPANPSEPIPILDEPAVWITSPMTNTSFNPDVLFEPPGLAVEVDGEFVPGQTLNLMASRAQSPGIGFHIQQVPVTDTLSPGTLYVRTTPVIVRTTSSIWLRLRVFTAADQVLSVDSVKLHFR